MKKTLLFALALAVIPVGVDAQDTTRVVGDWQVRESLDPFDDSPRTIIYLAAEGATSFSSGIRLFAIRCGIGGPGLLSLYVTHSFMGGDNDDNVRMTYRLGDAEARTVTGRLTADNDGTVFSGLNAPEVTALLSSPRVAVRIVDLLDNDTYQENWTDLEGTAEVLSLVHCLASPEASIPEIEDGNAPLTAPSRPTAIFEFVNLDTEKVLDATYPENFGDVRLRIEVKNTGTCVATLNFEVQLLNDGGFPVTDWFFDAGTMAVGESKTLSDVVRMARAEFDEVTRVRTADSRFRCVR
jgi:hypothetical protein